MMTRAAIAFVLLCCTSLAGAADEVVTRGSNLTIDAGKDARLLMDLSGALWAVPPGGGVAVRIAEDPGLVRRPRWSPDGTLIVYASNGNGRRGLRLYELDAGVSRPLGSSTWLDLHPSWHPGGERVVFASDRRDTGFDIWEVDVQTGLEWRLTGEPGDETDPAWSQDGRDLVYVRREADRWSLVLREHGQPEEILVSSEHRLAGPSWRPDGSLIMFWRHGADGMALDMVILSRPRLVRRYMEGEDYTTTPVSWLDRHRMYYSADGLIRQRLFNSWASKTVPFRATIDAPEQTVVAQVRRKLPRIDEPQGTRVIHAARLFDGIGGGYQLDRDIVIERGRIVAVEAHAERPGAIVIDMGDLAVVPGLVDVNTRLPEGTDEATGPLLLAAGVTTIVADHDEAEHLNTVWSGKALPGPRLLPAADWPVAKYSGLADSLTPGLDSVLRSRAARLIGFDDPVARRFSDPPKIDHGATDMILGSRTNGLPAGIAAHAELRALQAAGLTAEQALRAAGVNAAAALAVDPQLGRIATGAVADFILVDGDPLRQVDDLLHVVAVVRNGRFFSVAGLIERAASAENVE
jgi:hypothetical protein